MPKIVELQINGARRRVDSDAEKTLLSALRDDLDLTGTKYGCGEGQCGACTVLIDGVATRSCLTKLATLAGKQITTIEGLEQNGQLHPLQDAFIEKVAMQCGYCTAGMIMSGVGLLKKNTRPSLPEIKAALEGNICRCGTYPRIVEAVQRASNSSAKKGASK